MPSLCRISSGSAIGHSQLESDFSTNLRPLLTHVRPIFDTVRYITLCCVEHKHVSGKERQLVVDTGEGDAERLQLLRCAPLKERRSLPVQQCKKTASQGRHPPGTVQHTGVWRLAGHATDRTRPAITDTVNYE